MAAIRGILERYTYDIKGGDYVKQPDWYKHGWTLDIKNQSWTEDTKNQVDFIIQTLKMTGRERVLDLACGYGRHSLELASRGYSVTGVDITEAYIDDATKTAKEMSLDTTFICSDIRNVSFSEEFDVVLNLADGAIGYLELDIVWTVYHLVIYMQSNKIHKVFYE